MAKECVSLLPCSGLSTAWSTNLYRQAKSHALGRGLGDSTELMQSSLKEEQLCSHLLCQAARHSFALKYIE